MWANIFISLFGILIFLFLFWKQLKDDYLSSSIFSIGFYIILGIVAGELVSAKFFPRWWFWTSLAGASLGFGIGFLRFKPRFYEIFEATALSLLPWLGLFFLSDSVVNSSPFSLSLCLFVSALILLSYFLSKSYKTFSWYKSGRIGFTGLAITGLFFLLRAAIALLFPFMLSFVGKSEVFLSGAVAFILFLLLFNLSKV